MLQKYFKPKDLYQVQFIDKVYFRHSLQDKLHINRKQNLQLCHYFIHKIFELD